MNKELIDNAIIAKINYCVKHHKYCVKHHKTSGFWVKGKCTCEVEEINPYLHFPSEKVCKEELMNVFNTLTEKDYEPKVASFCQTYEDGDEITELPKPIEGNVVIHTDIHYNEDGPYVEVRFEYSGYETDEMISNRLFVDIWYKATRKYVERLDTYTL